MRVEPDLEDGERPLVRLEQLLVVEGPARSPVELRFERPDGIEELGELLARRRCARINGRHGFRPRPSIDIVRNLCCRRGS